MCRDVAKIQDEFQEGKNTIKICYVNNVCLKIRKKENPIELKREKHDQSKLSLKNFIVSYIK